MALVLRNPGKTIPVQYLACGLILLLLSACNLGGDNIEGYVSPYGTTPIANPDYDDSSAGVYRGVLVGSQGIFQIYIANEPDVYEAYLQFDDSSCTLYTEYFSDNPDWEPGGQVQIENAIFEGTFPDDGTTWANENATIDFSVGANGGITNNMVEVTIGGHTDPIIVLVSKERSDQLVLQYVGRAYNDSGDPWADWGFLVICPEGSEDIEVLGYMVDKANIDNKWDVQTFTPGDGVTGVIFNENQGVAPIEGQTPTVDLTGFYEGSNYGRNVKIHGEFDTAKWPDQLSGWWKSYIGTWGSGHTQVAEGEWDSERTPAPELGGIQIDISGQPLSFFDGRICHYAICESGGNPNNPADRIAEGTINLVSGSGICDVENIANGQYDIFVAIDVDDDGFTYSEIHLPDGDLHDAAMNRTVDGDINDVIFTLKTVAGEVSWSDPLSGDLYVALCSHVEPDESEIDYELGYSGIANATTATYAIDATELGGGTYYLLGVLTTPPTWQRAGWYADANAADGGGAPVDLSNLQDSYDFELDK
jgi:hypothetical protein